MQKNVCINQTRKCTGVTQCIYVCMYVHPFVYICIQQPGCYRTAQLSRLYNVEKARKTTTNTMPTALFTYTHNGQGTSCSHICIYIHMYLYVLCMYVEP